MEQSPELLRVRILPDQIAVDRETSSNRMDSGPRLEHVERDLMLVLSRDDRESIVIEASNGERIVVTVLRESRGDLVKLAIDAPRQVKILRAELEAVNHEQSKASRT